MQNFLMILLILTPLFVGFMIPSSKKGVIIADTVLRYLVIIILAYIGIELAQIEDFYSKIGQIAGQVLLLAVLCIGSGLVGLMIFDKFFPWHVTKDTIIEHQPISIHGTLLQVVSVIIGFIIGRFIPPSWLPPEHSMTVLLMILILMVGISLKGSGVTLKEVLINKRGVQTSIIFTVSVLLAGIVYSCLNSEVSITQGMALSSGFGWYSLSAVVMTEAYGAVWGSVALFNDLFREIVALIFIPIVMRRFPSSAVGLGGATSLDFTLPIIQQSGGVQVVPLAISFGFIINIISPLLMVLFSSF